MENYTLYIPEPPQRRSDGTFNKGHVPFNKGVPMEEWMPKHKIERVKKYLELGRVAGNKNLAGHNKIPIVGIKDGKLYPFESASDAARKLKAKGIRIHQRNITNVCQEKLQRQKCHGKVYFFIRKHAGGFKWFYADDVEKYMHLIK